MNDLAQKAVDGAFAVGRHVARRPLPPLALAGFVAAAVTVVAGGRLGAAPDALPLTRWLYLLAPAGYDVTDDVPGTVMLVGIAALVSVWLVAVQLARLRRLRERAVWVLMAAWSAPFVIGPPLLGTDVYSSVADGLLAWDGRSPYQHSPLDLGAARVVAAIDPNWRGTASTGGPLSTAIEHLSVSVTAGNALTAVIVLRLIALLSAIAIGRFAAELSGARRPAAVALTALNPLVLLYVISGARLDGLAAALLLAALTLAGQRRWAGAIVLAGLAAGVKPVLLVAIPALIVAHAIGQRDRVSWRIAGRDTLIAAATLAVATLSVPDGVGWAGNLDASTHVHTFWAPANLLSDAIAPIVSSASYDDLAIGGRFVALLAAATAVGYLLVTVLQRPLERTVGYALLALGLFAPALYPWYLVWGLACLAPSATRHRLDWVLALSCAGAVLYPAGFGTGAAQVITVLALVLIAGGLMLRHRLRAEAVTPATV